MGDILFIFQRFQKKLQSNSLTLVDMDDFITKATSSLESLKLVQIPGDYEDTSEKSIERKDGKIFLKNIELSESSRTRSNAPPFETIRKNVIDVLVQYLKQRFETDKQRLLQYIEPFVGLEKDADIQKIHEIFGKDLNLANIYLQFQDLVEANDLKEMSLAKLVQFLRKDERKDAFEEIAILLSRILACTPHTGDVERCVSLDNKLKTNLRSSMSLITENKYLYLHTNMPCLNEFDPRPAIDNWFATVERRNRTINSGTVSETKYLKSIYASNDGSEDDEPTEKLLKFQF